jgi:HPt (histidine-containing phosphotransfer) domain-containing protein
MNDSSHVDTDTLNMLKDIMEDGFANLLQTFIDDSKLRIDELRQALNESNADGVRRAAHSLKGSSGNLGANSLAALCLTVESQSKDGDLNGLDAELKKIEQEYQQVVNVMTALL